MHKPGTIVGKRYRCRHLLAEGGMAEVYLAEREDEHGAISLFALKRLLPSLTNNPIFADMFAYEASLSSSFSHKNIVRCEEFFREDNDYYMALEFVLGKEVGAIAYGARTWSAAERLKLACAIGLGVCDALSYVHTKEDQFGATSPVVHGDISPQNIMVDMNGVIKIYDFGAAKTGLQSLPFEEKVVRGNPRYMSPEQMAGATIGATSDIYSLCLILLEIIVGDARFDRGELRKNLRVWLKALDLSVPIEKALVNFFAQGLQEESAERFLSSAALREQLSELAMCIGLFDAQNYLEHLIKADGPSLQSKPIRRRARQGRLFFLVPLLASLLGVSAWVLIAVFATTFEPVNQHSLPVWPVEHEVHEPVVETRVVARAPVLEPAKLRSHVGKHGMLLVKVKPWAEVFIDGQFFGSTPMGSLNLPEGNYLVQLRNPDVSAVALKMVKIYADKKTELVHNF